MSDLAIIPTVETRPEGRPSKYDPAYCDQIILHMADGSSAASFAAEIGVSRATINVWADAHPEFLEALGIAKAKCASWWEKQGRAVAQSGGGPGQGTMIAFGLKNMGREDWQEKVALVGGDPASGDKPIQVMDVSDLSPDQLAALASIKVPGE